MAEVEQVGTAPYQRSLAYGMQPPPDDPNDLVMFAPLLEQLREQLLHAL